MASLYRAEIDYHKRNKKTMTPPSYRIVWAVVVGAICCLLCGPPSHGFQGIIFGVGRTRSFVSQSSHLEDRQPFLTRLRQSFSDDAPSDYDSDDIQDPGQKTATVDVREEDAQIRDALKRELLLLSSVTNRGEYANLDEQNICVDLVSQLEALNPTPDPASNSAGEWDLCLSSTQFFRSSPFFSSIRVAMGDSNKDMVDNGFDLHDRATTTGRIGRVRQTISSDKLVSEVDLEVGLLPGLPIRTKGTVVTTASLSVVSPDTFTTQIISTHIVGSNIPFLNELLDDPKLELPVGDAYQLLLGEVPVVSTKTFYVDEAMRIVRDVDDNFFVFTRA